MPDLTLVNNYCFNESCKFSIFHPESCVVVKRTLRETMNVESFCASCGSKLLSKRGLSFEKQVRGLLNRERTYSSIVVGRNPVFYENAQRLFQDSDCFAESFKVAEDHVLQYLSENVTDITLIPDYIFFEPTSSVVDIWNFCDGFDLISPKIKKDVAIYLITNEMKPSYNDLTRTYANVKSLKIADFNVEFLNDIC